MFYEKYFPISVGNVKALEFIRLQQRNMSASEYAVKFEELFNSFTNFINVIVIKHGSVLNLKVVAEGYLTSISPMNI